ncbi:hypothetical protein SALBM135S_06486 [Streptomyces alboniger]
MSTLARRAHAEWGELFATVRDALVTRRLRACP